MLCLHQSMNRLNGGMAHPTGSQPATEKAIQHHTVLCLQPYLIQKPQNRHQMESHPQQLVFSTTIE
jgi:hypothetical protein